MTAKRARAVKRRKGENMRFRRSYQKIYDTVVTGTFVGPFYTAGYLRFASAPYEPSDALLLAAGYDASKSERYTYIPARPTA